jgi:hypothetical protein
VNGAVTAVLREQAAILDQELDELVAIEFADTLRKFPMPYLSLS